MDRTKIAVLLAVLAITLSGCTETPDVSQVDKICTQALDIKIVMDSAEDVLMSMNFSIAKADVKQGYISTYPVTGSQTFEFWKKQNVGSFNQAEADLHTIRRTIEMNITQEAHQICIDCVAFTERMSLPERHTTGSSQASSLFTRSGGSYQQLALNKEQQADMDWIDLGRDPELEAEILRRLKTKL